MASDWAHTIQLAKEVRDLHKRIKDLEEIEEEHRNLNGTLRIEIASLKKHLQTHCKENI